MTEKIPLLPKIEEMDSDVEQQKLAKDLFGMFEVVSAVPTGVPINYLEQIKIYTNGATFRLYWYDQVANTWHWVTASG